MLGSTQAAPHTFSGATQTTVPLELELLELLDELVTPLLELDAVLELDVLLELVTPPLELDALLEELVTPLLELDPLLEALVAPLPEPEVLVVSPLELEALVAPLLELELEESSMGSSIRAPQLTLVRSEAATQSVTARAVVRHREGSIGVGILAGRT